SSASPAPAPAAGEGAASAASIKNPAPAAVAAPPADAEAPRPSHRFVVVARGDTLSTIAIRHLGSLSAVRSLMRLNPHITDAGHVYPGEKVYLPAAAPVASTENPDDSDVE
ncbi:MAG TPA: LysM domain-containing protein, partial [Candidatus Binataceae bacterium]|nr:LysM domain-containing protein [Candidatus Binataceae bacterium]